MMETEQSKKLYETELKLQEALSQNLLIKEQLFNRIYEAMEQDLNCSICSELFIEPRILDCSHTFCSHCIGQWTRGGKRNCPLCRKVNLHPPINHTGIANLIAKIHMVLSPEMQSHREQVILERSNAVAALAQVAPPAANAVNNNNGAAAAAATGQPNLNDGESEARNAMGIILNRINEMQYLMRDFILDVSTDSDEEMAEVEDAVPAARINNAGPVVEQPTARLGSRRIRETRRSPPPPSILVARQSRPSRRAGTLPSPVRGRLTQILQTRRSPQQGIHSPPPSQAPRGARLMQVVRRLPQTMQTARGLPRIIATCRSPPPPPIIPAVRNTVLSARDQRQLNRERSRNRIPRP